MTSPDEMLATFLTITRFDIESGGELRLPHAVWHDREADGVVLEALDLPPQEITLRCINTIDSDKCSFMVFGLDMSSLPKQGLEFDDFVLVFEWRAERPEPLRDQLRIGVINYRKGDPPIVRAIDWENAYWKDHAFNLVKHFVPFRVRVKRAAAASI